MPRTIHANPVSLNTCSDASADRYPLDQPMPRGHPDLCIGPVEQDAAGLAVAECSTAA